MKNEVYANVFGWLFIGLLCTFTSGYLISTNVSLLTLIFSTSAYWFLFIAQIVLCLVFSLRITKMNSITAKVLYLLYTVLTGATFASIFVLFEMSSIIFIFFVTSLIFGVFALIGKTTNIDLSKWGIYLLMGLLSIIVMEIINIFIMNNTLDIIACCIGIVIFTAYIAYDMQRIKHLNDNDNINTNLAVYGAFELYLDFINLFIKLLRLFGKSRD